MAEQSIEAALVGRLFFLSCQTNGGSQRRSKGSIDENPSPQTCSLAKSLPFLPTGRFDSRRAPCYSHSPSLSSKQNALAFLYNYFFRLGFLDGREGLLLHCYHAVYVSWKYAKAWEMSRKP